MLFSPALFLHMRRLKGKWPNCQIIKLRFHIPKRTPVAFIKQRLPTLYNAPRDRSVCLIS